MKRKQADAGSKKIVGKLSLGYTEAENLMTNIKQKLEQEQVEDDKKDDCDSNHSSENHESKSFTKAQLTKYINPTIKNEDNEESNPLSTINSYIIDPNVMDKINRLKSFDNKSSSSDFKINLGT